MLQNEYNLAARLAYPSELQQLCLERGVAMLPYYALASGFLSGKYRTADQWEGTARRAALDKVAEKGGWEVLEAMRQIVQETGAGLAQIALAWLNAQPGIAAPIASATSQEQLADLVAGARLELAPEHLAAVDRAVIA